MNNGRLVSNPDQGHVCDGMPLLVSVADQVLKESKQEIARTGRRPKVAFREVLADVTQNYGVDAGEISLAIDDF